MYLPCTTDVHVGYRRCVHVLSRSRRCTFHVPQMCTSDTADVSMYSPGPADVPSMYHRCARRIPQMCPCTLRVPPMYLPCTTDVRVGYRRCVHVLSGYRRC